MVTPDKSPPLPEHAEEIRPQGNLDEICPFDVDPFVFIVLHPITPLGYFFSKSTGAKNIPSIPIFLIVIILSQISLTKGLQECGVMQIFAAISRISWYICSQTVRRLR